MVINNVSYSSMIVISCEQITINLVISVNLLHEFLGNWCWNQH